MTVGELLDEIRASYLTQFRSSIAGLKEAGADIEIEPAYRDENGDAVPAGLCRLPMRMDIAKATSGGTLESIRVDSNGLVFFEPLAFEWSDDSPITFAAFFWDCCHVHAMGVDASANWLPLCTWFERWFDDADENMPDSDGLYGVVHFLSEPIQGEGSTAFEVDFGSAPVEAFEAFLDALRESGATGIELGCGQ